MTTRAKCEDLIAVQLMQLVDSISTLRENVSKLRAVAAGKAVRVETSIPVKCTIDMKNLGTALGGMSKSIQTLKSEVSGMKGTLDSVTKNIERPGTVVKLRKQAFDAREEAKNSALVVAKYRTAIDTLVNKLSGIARGIPSGKGNEVLRAVRELNASIV